MVQATLSSTEVALAFCRKSSIKVSLGVCKGLENIIKLLTAICGPPSGGASLGYAAPCTVYIHYSSAALLASIKSAPIRACCT